MNDKKTDSRHSVIKLMAFRVFLIFAVSFAAWMVFRASGNDIAFPPGMLFSAIGLIPVNIVCWLAIARLLKKEGSKINDFVGFFKKQLGRDIAYGILWVAVLFIPFVAAMMLTSWFIHGSEMFVAFETMFYNADTSFNVSPQAMLILGIITLVTFAPLNAPVEELIFRGYSQSHLSRKLPTWISILICSLFFGFQHIFFASSRDAMLVYFVAFTVWGFCSGIIVHKQKRLMPIVIAHFFVNIMTSAPALIFPILTIAGLINY